MPIYVCGGRDTLLGDGRCRARSLKAEIVEEEVRRTIRQILDDPSILFDAAEPHHRKLAGREVDVRRETEVAQKELAAIQRRRANLLDLAVDGAIPNKVFTERDAPMAVEEERLTGRLAELNAEAASSRAAASKQKAMLAHAKLLRRGLDDLAPADWRNFLSKLIDEIVVGPTALDPHLVLPAAQAASQRSNHASSNSSTLAAAGFGSFSSSW